MKVLRKVPKKGSLMFLEGDSNKGSTRILQGLGFWL